MKKIEITKEQLQQMIKEGVERLHRQTLIENRIEQINNELNALKNPESWEESKKDAQNQLRKKTIAFNNMIPRERLMNEGFSEKGIETVKKWIETEGSRVAAKKIIDSLISRMLGGMTSSDLPDTVTFANGLDTVEEFLNAGDFNSAYEEAKNTAKEMIEEEGGDLFGENLNEKKYSDAASDFIGKEISHLMHDKNYEHDRAVAAAINIAKDKGYKVPAKTNEGEEMQMYYFRIKHDNGTVRIKTSASSEAAARTKIANAEGAPESALEFIKSEPLAESAPSAGLSSKQKSDVVKKAKAGEDIGKKGKGFKDVVANAKASGAEDPKAVAAAAMWKNIKRESIAETMKKAYELLDEANKKLKQKGK